LLLEIGDTDGYHRLCHDMMERFGGARNVDSGIHLVRACVMSPGADADCRSLRELAQSIADCQDSPFYYTLGIADYRAGEFALAITHFRKSLAKWPMAVLCYPILAMAHHRLGQADQAREAMDKAAETNDKWIQQRYQGTKADWSVWPAATCEWP